MTRSNVSGFRCLVGAMMLAGVSVQARGQSDNLAAIRAAISLSNRTYIEAHAKGDADLIASIYDTAGTRLNPGGQVIRGRTAIRAEVAGMLALTGPIEVTLSSLDLWLHDGRAYETGVWSYAFTPAGSQRRKSGGRYLTIWTREADSSWRIAVDISLSP